MTNSQRRSHILSIAPWQRTPDLALSKPQEKNMVRIEVGGVR